MHLPEALLARRSFGSGCRGQRVRVDVGEGEVPEHKTKAALEPPLDALDLAVRTSCVPAFVVAVLDEERSVLRAAHVVDQGVDSMKR